MALQRSSTEVFERMRIKVESGIFWLSKDFAERSSFSHWVVAATYSSGVRPVAALVIVPSGSRDRALRLAIKMAPKSFGFNRVTKTDLENSPIGASALKFRHRRREGVGERCGSYGHGKHKVSRDEQMLIFGFSTGARGP